MELSLSTRGVAGHVVLEVGGEVDVYTAPQLRERLIALVEGGARLVIVDLARVDFLDSTGLGVLVGALKRLRGVDGELALVCSQERLLKIFRITGLDRVFSLYDTVEQAAAGVPGDALAGSGEDPRGLPGGMETGGSEAARSEWGPDSGVRATRNSPAADSPERRPSADGPERPGRDGGPSGLAGEAG